MAGLSSLSVLCVVVACCLSSAAANFHGLFEHASFDDYVHGHEYAPQPSAFEAALKGIEKYYLESAVQVEVVVEGTYEPSLPEIDDTLLPDDHPHKRPVEVRIKSAVRNVAIRNRRIGTFEKTPTSSPLQSDMREGEQRRLFQLSEMEDEAGRRMLGKTDTKNALSVVTNGAIAPGPTTPPSAAAIGSDFYRFGSVALPQLVNWTMTKAATFVHFEGAFCQSCWAIAVADAVSMMWLIHGGKGSVPVGAEMLRTDKNYGNPAGNGGADMSPQQICDGMGVSCCTGGWPESALEFVHINGGLDQWLNYPYLMTPNVSQESVGQNNVVAMVTGFEAVPAGNIQAFMQAVSMVPVIAFISSSSADFGSYTGGIFNGSCGSTIDHVVLITGYGTDPVAGPYWIIKNAWGPYWGEYGYMRIVMTPGNGKCGLTSSRGLYPVYFPTNSNPCLGTPNPCGSGTCFAQNLPGGGYQARCGCPSGYVENAGTWPTPSKCVRSNPCDANPNPCGAGTCKSFPDGSYSCACPASMVAGSTTGGNPLCVASGAQTYTVQPADTCMVHCQTGTLCTGTPSITNANIITTAYSTTSGSLAVLNPWLNCSSSSLQAGAVIVLGNTSVPAGSSTYVSQVQETCASIAYGYGITLATLQLYNPAVICATLPLGTNLVLPPATGTVLPSTIPPTCNSTYSVVTDDTCVSVSAKLGISNSTLTRLNPDISCSKPLAPPTTLCVSVASNGATSSIASCTQYYSVRQGDTCPFIWMYANLTMTQFLSANPGIRCDSPHLWVGEQICIAAPIITLAIPAGVPYIAQPNDTLGLVSYQWTIRCGLLASVANIIVANPTLAGAVGSTRLSPGVQLDIPCPNAGCSDACGCPSVGPSVCGSDNSWYYSSCDSNCNGAGLGYPSCTACAVACFGRVTLPPLPGTAWGCTANNGGICLPTWNGYCQSWLAGCQNQCNQAQWYGTSQNNNYWNCLSKCRGGC